MNMSVFFVVENFSPEWIFSLENIFFPIISTLIAMSIFYGAQFFYKKFYKKSSSNPIFSVKKFYKKNPLPHISDTDFSKKIFQYFQIFLAEKYLPKNTPAHTADDIARYCYDEDMKQFYKKLENEAFSGNISDSEKQENLKILQKFLQK